MGPADEPRDDGSRRIPLDSPPGKAYTRAPYFFADAIMKTPRKGHSHAPPKGPSQRQLRAGELVRHALVEILREEDFADPALHEVSVPISATPSSLSNRSARAWMPIMSAPTPLRPA